jgi:hypothetical protein
MMQTRDRQYNLQRSERLRTNNHKIAGRVAMGQGK